MATVRIIIVCLLLLTTSLPLPYVTSFAIHKRHSRSTDLGDALRMLERQRQRFGNEDDDGDDDELLASRPELMDDRPMTIADLEPWFNVPESSTPEETLDAAWLAKSLGLDAYNGVEGLPEELPYLQRPLLPSPVKIQPTDQELDAIFGEKAEDVDKKRRADSSPSTSKKDKEVMTDLRSDVKEETVPVPGTRSAAASTDDVIEVKTTSDSSDDDVKLTKEEFKALLKAVEKLQKQAIQKADEDMEEAGKALAEVKDKVVEAQENAQEAVEAVAEEARKAEEEEEEAEKEEEEEEGALKPQPVSKEELDNMFEDQSEEVIPTDHGEIVKTEKTLRDPEGRPVGREETVEEVEESGEPGKATLNSIEDFWYLKNYLDQEGDRKKRNSKRNYIPPSLGRELALPEVISPPDSSELIAAYVQKINELQSELDQTKLEAYLEDVENDILTDALNQATLAQVRGRINPEELVSLQDAIRVEEALQEVKTNRLKTDELVDEADEDESDDLAADDGQKRGEPWKKRNDVSQAEVPVFLTGDSDDVTEDDDDNDVGDDSEEETTSVALGNWFDDNQPKVSLDDLLEASAEDLGYLGQRADGDLIGRPTGTKVASLFSNTADQCPAVQEFSTNCDFAGDSIDFEARALCNVHEMCYACGQSLGVGQSQCDFIYRAASTILCQQDEECVLEAGIFLNTMKLKHRFVPYSQPVCSTQCTAQFLSIV